MNPKEIPPEVQKGLNEVGRAELERIWPDLSRQPYWHAIATVQMFAIINRRPLRAFSKRQRANIKQLRAEFAEKIGVSSEILGLSPESRRRRLSECPGQN